MTEPEIPREVVVTPKVDAAHRAVRSFFQGLAFDLLAAVVLFAMPVVLNAKSWEDFDWAILGFLFAKTLLVTVLSYVMRYFSIAKGTLPPAGEGAAGI